MSNEDFEAHVLSETTGFFTFILLQLLDSDFFNHMHIKLIVTYPSDKHLLRKSSDFHDYITKYGNDLYLLTELSLTIIWNIKSSS